MANSVDDNKMSFLEHLGELRIRITRALIALLILIRHIPNMKRLLSGTEPALISRGSKKEGA